MHNEEDTVSALRGGELADSLRERTEHCEATPISECCLQDDVETREMKDAGSNVWTLSSSTHYK
jgi:hypothetical protein